MANFKPLPVNPPLQRFLMKTLAAKFKAVGLGEYAPYCDYPSGPLTLIPELADASQPGVALPEKELNEFRTLLVDAVAFLHKQLLGLPVKGAGNGLGAAFNEFDGVVTALQADFRRIWLRRIALAIHVDQYEGQAWKISHFQDWQISVLLAWNPFTGLASKNGPKLFRDAAFTAKDNGHDFWIDPTTLAMTMRFVWDPNPLDFYYEAHTMGAMSAGTPAMTCSAVVSKMRELGFFHGHLGWYGKGPFKAGSYVVKTDKQASVDCTAGQLIAAKMGGCWINSRYIQKILRTANLPTVASVRRGFLPSTKDKDVDGSGRVSRVYDKNASDGDHYGVVCYGSDMAILHGDDALGHAEFYRAGQWSHAEGDTTWRPARALYFLEQAAGESTSDADAADFKKEMIEAVAWAAAAPDSPIQELPWKEYIKSQVTRSSKYWFDPFFQLFSAMAWAPGTKVPLVAGFASHWGWTPLKSPYTPSFNLRPRQVLTKAFAVACVPLIDLDHIDGAEDLDRTWALNMFVAWVLLMQSPDDPVAIAKVRKYCDMFFLLERSMHPVAPGGDKKSAYRITFPSDAALDKNFQPGDNFYSEPLDRVLFPGNCASHLLPQDTDATWDATLLRMSDIGVAQQAIFSFAAQALKWFLIDRLDVPPGEKPYTPGDFAPKGYSVFASS